MKSLKIHIKGKIDFFYSDKEIHPNIVPSLFRIWIMFVEVLRIEFQGDNVAPQL